MAIKKEVAARKKTIKKEAVVESSTKFLNSDELRIITEFHHKSESLVKDRAISLRDIELLKNKIEKLNLELSNMSLVGDNLKLQHTSFLKEIALKYSIAGNWGFNPITGEIV